MSDYQDSDFDESQSGYYRIWYGRTAKPAGPFETVMAMAQATSMTDYPDDGYVVFFDKDNGISSIPSLNPDELVQADLFRCIHCNAWIDASLGAEAPTGEEHEGTEDDPRPPGDWNNICDVCNYRDGKSGTPPPMERDEP